LIEGDSTVNSEQRRRTFRLASALILLGMGVGCAHASSKTAVDASVRGAGAIERQIQGAAPSAPRLDHIMPARDSQGRLPSRFEWTAVAGADSYSIGIWNEVDMLVWRMDGIPTNSF